MTILESDGIWFQSGLGRGWATSEELEDSNREILVKEKGIVRIEFSEFKDHDEGDWRGIDAGPHATVSCCLIKSLKKHAKKLSNKVNILGLLICE